MNFTAWYESHRSSLTQQGLWLRGGEINTISVSEWQTRPFHVLFSRLSTYFDTGYSFTHQYLYQLAVSLEGVFADLSYLPPAKDAEIFLKENIPWLLGTQTKRPALQFDLIGFSNSIVQELLNLPTLLSRSGLPLKKSQRLATPEVPILIMGGANALYTSCLWEKDPLVDGIFVGENEAAIQKIITIVRDGKKAGHTKEEILKELRSISGFFEPDKPQATKKAFVWSLNQSEPLKAGPVYYLEDQLGKGHLQISEGCPCFCSFCAESWDRKPYRERNTATLKKAALAMKTQMGLDTVELYSFNFNMHSDFYEILWELVPYFKKIGLKSQRFDLLAYDPQMIEFQHAIEKASITCGLEGISPRLRKYLHKNLETTDLHKSMEAIFRSKARELKIFLIATGLEQEQDFDALSDLLTHIATIQQKCQSQTRIILSMTPLVRFPWTPLEFEEAYSMEHYQKVIRETARRIQQSGFEFRESADLPEYWISQVLVRASDERIAKAWREAVAESKFVYYRKVPKAFQALLAKKLMDVGLAANQLLSGYSLEESRSKPWALIETGVKREFLWEEVVRARNYSEIDYCLGRAWQESKCFLCGGCPSPEHILAIVKTKQQRNYSLGQLKERMAQIRSEEQKFTFLVSVGPAGVGVPRKMVAVALSRALMMTHPELSTLYRGFTSTFWSPQDGNCWIEGLDLFHMSFFKNASRIFEKFDEKALKAINHHLGNWGTFVRYVPSLSKELMLSLNLKGPAPASLDPYLQSKGLAFTLKKRSENCYEYLFTSASAKKGLVKHVLLKKNPHTELTIKPGPKFSSDDFFKQVTPRPLGNHWKISSSLEEV